MTTLARTLRSLGLNEKEAEAYLALLAAGAVSASTLCARLSVPKSTARYLCRELAKKGLVSFSRRGNVFYYVAEPPEKLIAALDREKRKIEQKQEAAQRIMTELRAIARPESALPRVRFFEGAAGVLEAGDAMLAAVPEDAEILSFVHPMGEKEAREMPPDAPWEEVQKAFERQFRERLRKRITMRMIALRTPESEEWRKSGPAEKRETRLVDALPYHVSPGEVLLHGGRLFAWCAERGVVFGYLLENPGLLGMYHSMFELAWAAAEDQDV